MSRPERRRSWLGTLALVPGAVLPLLPSATCPFCIAAYAGFASALGLGFLFNERVLAPLIAVFLGIGVVTIAWSTRSHRRPGPLVATIGGALVVVAARLVWRVPPLMYAGVAVLIAASIWNLWLKRPARKPEPLVQLRLGRKQGEA
jgi:hypothetical protein